MKSDFLIFLQLLDPNGVLIQPPLQLPHFVLGLIDRIYQCWIDFDSGLVFGETLQKVLDVILRRPWSELFYLTRYVLVRRGLEIHSI